MLSKRNTVCTITGPVTTKTVLLSTVIHVVLRLVYRDTHCKGTVSLQS